jgi:hypothetical protein
MPDRYEDGVHALQTIDVPDQWAEIEARAATGLIVPLDADHLGRGGRRRWPAMLAAAAALVLVVGGVTLVLSDDDDVRTTDPTMTTESTPPPTDRPDVLEGPGTPTSTAPDQAAPGPGDPAAPAPSQAPGGTGESVPDLTECPVDVAMTTSTAPAGWSARMTPATEWLPPEPSEGLDPRLVGVFEGPTAADFASVSAGFLGLQDDTFEPVPGPVPDVEAKIAPWTGGWYLEVFVPRPAGNCWVTVQAIGMSRNDAVRFVGGLEAR